MQLDDEESCGNPRAGPAHCRDMIHTCVLVLVVLAAACDRAEAPPPPSSPVPRIATLPRIVPARPAIPPRLAQPGDRDGDQIANDRDRCPDGAEDVDGFEDDDGCPDLDTDFEEILDVEDRCPDSAEVPEDGDGCPGEPMPITALRAM
jgi:hypothetical protein